MSDDRPPSMPDVTRQWVVLGEHAIDEFCRRMRCARFDDGIWTPDQGLVVEIAPVLATVLQHRLDDLAVRSERMTAFGLPITGPRHACEYFVQCVGIIRAGHRVVWLNGFRRPSGLAGTRLSDKARTSVIHICDGGPNSFRAEYDPATKQIVTLRFNGPHGSTNPAVDRLPMTDERWNQGPNNTARSSPVPRPAEDANAEAEEAMAAQRKRTELLSVIVAGGIGYAAAHYLTSANGASHGLIGLVVGGATPLLVAWIRGDDLSGRRP